MGRPPGDGQGQPHRHLVGQAGRRLHRRERHPGQPAGLRRLPVDRLRDLHPQGGPGREPPGRPLGRDREDRVRYSPLTISGTAAPGTAVPPPLIAVAHGSSDPRAAASVGTLLDLVRQRAETAGFPGLDVRAAYLGHAAPSLAQALAALDGGPRDREAVVLPLLLTAAY